MIYLQHYPQSTQDQVQMLLDKNQLHLYLLEKYPTSHEHKSDKALFNYVQELKQSYMKKSSPLSKVAYNNKIHAIRNALGTHHFISRIQGSKLKSKNEIYVASMFKKTPEAFLRMIVVHELAHFKEKVHNKAFYKLCIYMEPDYHQYEFDLRVYMTYLEKHKSLYT